MILNLAILPSAIFESPNGNEVRAPKTKIPTNTIDNIFAVAKLFVLVNLLFFMTYEYSNYNEQKHYETLRIAHPI